MSLSSLSSKRKVLRPFIIIVAALVAAYLLYLSQPEPIQQTQEKSRLLVNAIEVVNETRQMTIRSQGTVLPSTETELSSEVQGRVIEVADNFVAGGFVKKGDLLLRIDDLEYRTAVARAQASIAAANTRLAEERGRADVAYQDWLRYNKEGKRSAQAKSLALREPQIAEALANVKAAQAELAKAKENLTRTTVIAPYDGLIRQRSVDLGQHVSVGTVLGVCFASDQIEVRLPVPENKLALLDLPSPNNQQTKATAIQLTLSLNNTDYHWQANLARVESFLDSRSRMLYLVASVDDPYRLNTQLKKHQTPDNKPLLRVGTFVDAVITGKTLNNIVRVPHDVLQTDNTVWVIDDNGQLQRQTVDVITNDGDYAFINSRGKTEINSEKNTELKEGDKIAIGYIDSGNIGNQVSIAELIRVPANNSADQANNRHATVKAATNKNNSEPVQEI